MMGQKESTKDIIVFYHGSCRDGFTAAWAAWKKFGDKADYIPLVWTSLNPNQIPEIKNKEIYFLDFTPIEKDIFRLIKENRLVVVVDHHISKEELIKKVPNSVYNNSHSGAVLAWKYFHPDKKVPQICLYVEDSDIWKWEISNSDKVLSYFDLKREFDFSVWDSLASDLEDEVKQKEYEEKGAIIVLFRQKVVKEIIREHAQLVNFEGYEVYAVNGPRYFKSEIGNELAKMKPPFGIVWSYTPDEISVSLRSISDEFDVTAITSKFNGGGHKTASNFRLPLGAPLPWKVIKGLNLQLTFNDISLKVSWENYE